MLQISLIMTMTRSSMNISDCQRHRPTDRQTIAVVFMNVYNRIIMQYKKIVMGTMSVCGYIIKNLFTLQL